MIDQASVFADGFKDNRQALQAAVLGQKVLYKNREVDPFSALRALQLLKKADSMQMAQQAQQPTDAPSLLQEAMQRPQMPMGMPIPGQQMAQAPQQGGGLEAMPVPEGDYAGGGIVAFAGGGGDIPEIQARLSRLTTEYQSAYREGKDPQKILDLKNEVQNLRKQLQDAQPAWTKYETMGMEMPGYDNPTPGKGETWDYLKREQKAYDLQKQRQLDDLLTAGSPANLDVRAAQDAAAAAATKAETAGLASRYPAPSQSMVPTPEQTPDVQASSMMSPGGKGLRALEAEAGISDGSVPIPRQEDDKQAPPIQTAGQTVPPSATKTGLGALATTSPLGTELDAKLKALSDFAFTDSKITPPRTLGEKIESAKTGTFEALKGLYGDDEASAKAQAILDKRLADLDDPDSKKFDKALAFFKSAGTMQKTMDKDGRRVTPFGALAEGAVDFASTYSTIKKEDRKARTLIEDAQMALDKAKQARKEGLVSKAFDLEEKADADRTKAEQLQAEINAKKDTAKAGLLSTAAQISSQRYNTDVTAMTAAERNRLTAEANILSKQGLLDQATDRALSAAATLVRQTEADIGRERNQDKDYTEALSIVSTMDGRKLSPQSKAMLDKAKATIAKREKSDQKRLDAAQRDYSLLARRAIDQANKTKTKTGGSSTLPPGFELDQK